ncbi:hypothetical protein WJX74_003153 [Apatococcus lobatus]|uniref:2Fe-2S ferredoxin-type domain-containing protein n=2 Tax=Apatococcus TaxID=904362 RepID=A0AAW1TAU2_9CHLO
MPLLPGAVCPSQRLWCLRHRSSSFSQGFERLNLKWRSTCSRSTGRPAQSRSWVGQQRFTSDAQPGMYWAARPNHDDNNVMVEFMTGTGLKVVKAPIGSNLLRLAEDCKALQPTQDFCFEGTCELCAMQTDDPVQELGPKAIADHGGMIRSCVACVPPKAAAIRLEVLSDDEVWSSDML